MGKLIAIPDIHGELRLLNKLLDKMLAEQWWTPGEDKLIFLGDMIDRGADSKGVIERIQGLQRDYPNTVALAGNHEWMAIDAVAKQSYDDFYFWGSNGGWATQSSYPTGKVPEDVIRWMAALPLSHEEDGFFFSHSAVPREEKRPVYLQGQPFSKAELTWTRVEEKARRHPNGIIGVCGHMHALSRGLKEPRFYEHYIFADAGCGCSSTAPLVAIDVRSREVISVSHP